MTKLFADRRATLRAIALLALAVALAVSGVTGDLDVPVAAQAPRSWYVVPNGRPTNPGTQAAPFDLGTALSATSPVRPGETIWLRGGLYRGSFVSWLRGTPAAPIVVRQYPGERAILDSYPGLTDSLLVNGAYVWFWGFEVRSSGPNRISTAPFATDVQRAGGVVSHAPGAKFINLVVHDQMNGIAVWASSPDSEVYGNLVYHNGYLAGDRGHGHGIYAQNRTGRQQFTDNIVFGGFSHGIHAYGSDAASLNNIQYEGNIVFNSGTLGPYFSRNLLIGGGRLAESPVVVRNYTYFEDALNHPGGENNFGYSVGCTNLTLRENYFAHIRKYPLALANCGGVVTGNTFLGWTDGSQATRYPVNSYGTVAPSGGATFVRPNRYEPGRSHVVVYNWDQRASVNVDLSGTGLALGDEFEVRDAQNFFGEPVAIGSFHGTPTAIPMTSTIAVVPIGNAPRVPQHTSRQFGAFVVLKRQGQSSPVPAPPPPTPVPPPPTPVPPPPPPPATQPSGSDLAITQTFLPGAPRVGQSVTFDVTVSNRGTLPAAGVMVSQRSLAEPWVLRSITAPAGCTAGQPATCQIGVLQPGASVRLQYVVATGSPGLMNSTVTVGGTGADPVPGNNSAIQTVRVHPLSGTNPPVPLPPAPPPAVPAPSGPANLIASQSIVMLPDGMAEVRVMVSNSGSSAAAGSEVSAMLRAQPWVIRSVAVSSASGMVCSGTFPVACRISGSLGAGQRVTLVLRVTSGALGGFASTVNVRTATPELTLDDNSAVATAFFQ